MIVLGSSEQNQTQSPRTERWRPKLSLLEKQSWKKKPFLPLPGLQHSLSGFRVSGLPKEPAPKP